MSRWWALVVVAAGAAENVPAAGGAGAAPVVFVTAPGRFEISAADPAGARAVTGAAEDAWRLLAAPLGLPDAFPSPVFVRLVSGTGWDDPEPFRVVVEAGGVVSLRILGSHTEAAAIVPRALVRAVLVRLAVARHGASGGVLVPAWLEHGALGWWQARVDGAQLDALKHQSARLAPPALDDVLRWRVSIPGHAPTGATAAGATWLFTLLHAEGGRTGEWQNFLDRLLRGEDSAAALALAFPARFATDRERELWWQAGWHHVRRVRTVPSLDAAESRKELATLMRFVFAPEDDDVVFSLRQVLERAHEAVVDAELRRRSLELARLTPALHPFYRNAGLSLAEALGARRARASRLAALCAAFEQDWRDANELHAATTAALDALEAFVAPGPN